jgi:hypothetical protein
MYKITISIEDFVGIAALYNNVVPFHYVFEGKVFNRFAIKMFHYCLVKDNGSLIKLGMDDEITVRSKVAFFRDLPINKMFKYKEKLYMCLYRDNYTIHYSRLGKVYVSNNMKNLGYWI